MREEQEFLSRLDDLQHRGNRVTADKRELAAERSVTAWMQGDK
jgi:hypothetical protein